MSTTEAGRVFSSDGKSDISRDLLKQLPARVRTTSHGIASASGKIGAFVGTYALTALLPRIGLGDTSALVGVVALAAAIVTVTLLPEPKGQSLEELTGENRVPTSATVLGMAESRDVRSPAQ
jgi:hypothetical protein